MDRIIQPLTQREFAGFGDVIEHEGDQRRRALSIDFIDAQDDMRRAFWVSKVSEAATLPTKVTQLERHPYSDQGFVPLRDTRFLVVVCPDDAKGDPDVERIKAFVAEPGQGVIYRRNVWHAPLSALTAPAEFFVTMGVTDKADNDEFFELATPLGISSGG
ncbi:ureidoglycolate hydrolase [Rhizobium sp. P32RR-XVIII]|uniref:ureidoglycolate lyase n=1 Tax=Rhizobium sp. P32RR-XVIII TaxID=2726738 RepID=UPI0018393695|nr:ureidoglycolate lyase [Rhizobium sp. P32RR-XVIII]NLS07056.1 ureidoglycolate hydrolase [Rhizobium sp. P32RR-XVIII]